jgi:hypothetical protein
MLGWMPVGKTVELKIDESSISSLSGRTLSAAIVSVDNDGVVTLQLNPPIDQDGKTIHAVAAYPRHKGYDVYHIALGVIAVDLVSPPANEPKVITGEEAQGMSPRFALARMACRKG